MPSTDLPFLCKLKDEVEDAVEFILQLDSYRKLDGIFSKRSNPKFTKFSYVIASKENEMLMNILELIQAELNSNLTIVCLVFDALIIQEKNPEKKAKILECIQKVS